MTETITSRVLLDNRNAVDPAYVELFDDGKVKAGYYPDTANTYGSAEEAYAVFRQRATAGSHAAWSICYLLEEYLATKDDGR